MGSIVLPMATDMPKTAVGHQDHPHLFHRDRLLQVRTGKVKPAFGLSESSAIFKEPLSNPVFVSKLGCTGDERAWEPHTGPENALMHYPSQHYELWASEIPTNAHFFKIGGFGENLVSSNASEENVCIGDIMRIGKEVQVQVTKPRQPCFKLNHRFELKDMSARSQKMGRTGWYYKILRDGWIEAGDEIVLIERRWPRWTIREVQRLLYVDRKDVIAMRELNEVPDLGEEIRLILEARLMKKEDREDSARLLGGEENFLKWSRYRVIEKKQETPRICSFIFANITPDKEPNKVKPGSHVRVKLGAEEKLVRAYSVISGDTNRFKLGIALEPKSRGGSKFIHEEVEVGDTLNFSDIKSDFPLHPEADEHLMVAGGIGITAFITAAQQLQESDMNYHLYYAVRTAEDVAFSENLKSFGQHVTILDSSRGQRINIKNIILKSHDRTHIYVCGPDRLLSAVTSTAKELNFPHANIHFEAFVTATSGDPFSAELLPSKTVLEVKEEQTLLDVLRDAGFDIESTCEVGNCGTCKVKVCGGRVEHRGTELMANEKKDLMLSCVSRGIGRIVLEL